jgi:D-lyxose ketol-isomerase
VRSGEYDHASAYSGKEKGRHYLSIRRDSELCSNNPPKHPAVGSVRVQIKRKERAIPSGESFVLKPGERITLIPGIWHEFAPSAPDTLVAEVSTWCDEATDNFFADSRVNIFHDIESDEAPQFPGFSAEAEA